MANDVILKAEHITQKFGGLTAVNDVSMEVQRNEIVGLIGPNGAGKSTFFNNLTGITPPTEGKVFFNNNEITGKEPYKIARIGISRTFQNIRLFSEMTVIENVIAGMYCRNKSGWMDAFLGTPRFKMEEKACKEKAEEILEFTGLSDFKYRYANSLSYGNQRRLEIARAIATDPEIIMLDEPAAGMNEQETTDLLNFIKVLQNKGYSIFLIEHDMRFVMNLCNRIYVLNFGQLIAEGPPEKIKRDPQVMEAYLGKGVS